MQIIPIILSGGSGTRLWPLSRQQRPKQYLSLTSDKTMLQETLMRLNGLPDLSKPIIICNVEHRFLVAQQCQQINITKPTILLEPIAKNTAPAIAAAALQAIKNSADAMLLVLPADHLIQDIDAFHQAIKIASKQAQSNKLTTFGIKPTNANTAYGYIHKGAAAGAVFKIKAFTEKPDQKTAQKFFKSNHYLWNSGMFMFKASTLIHELTTYAPDIIKAVKASVDNALDDFDFIRLEQASFALSANISIDYALMEKSHNVVVVPLDAKWSDVGSFLALSEIGTKDANDNVIQGDALTWQTTNTYINAKKHLIATIGVQDLIIINTHNATLIANKNKAQQVKNIVAQLQKDNKETYTDHHQIYRPWGWYESIKSGEYFQVKKLHINPNAKISLQTHQKRAEHWVVVSGTATVVNGVQKLTLNQGDSTYIPLGGKHGVANHTKKPLEIIEVQSGTYLGEDDIVRFEDIY